MKFAAAWDQSMNDIFRPSPTAPVFAGHEPVPDSTPMSYLWYETTYLFSMVAFTLGFSLRTEGRSCVPQRGPVLVVANHQSFLDPILVGLASRRHLCFLARKTLFRNRFFARLIRSLNAVPIDQDGVAKDGLKTIVELLRKGHAVVVFPEGERTADGVMHEFKAGIHLLLRKAETTIVPVGIAGAYDAWPRWRMLPVPAPLFLPSSEKTLAVSVGQPLDGRRFSSLPRTRALAELFHAIHHVQQRAEKLRRK
jgi:1-acyl-sn-glycerol-3-phosphate acyltransferase